ncbi:MAG: ATP-binding domain-containing protein, partial [Bacteroidetes bacterium]|nr:ATP-binding domain-containing protein [Bacteroidota bacterium]
WAERYSGIDFIANGDIAEIVRIRRYREMYGFRFVEVSMRLVDYDQEIDCLVLVDSLDAPTPSDNDAIGRKLFEEVEKDYIHIGNKRTRYIEMRRNEYLNAIQIKFAYAITCHKSQGGQWRHVYIDTGYLTEPMLGKEFLQWLYTATTRCRERLFLVDFSRRFIAGGK